MKRNILRKGFLVLAAAAAVQVGVSSMDASAAANNLSAKNIKIDYENQKLIIGNDGSNTVKDLQIYYGVGTVKVVTKKIKDPADDTGKKKITVKQNVMTVASWDEYDYSANMQIDLSTLNRAKDNYIQVKGSGQMTPITIKIPKINTKVQAKFDAVAGTVVLNDITNKKEPKPVTQALEYRTNYGGWKDYATSEKLSVYQDRGATLYFRVKASATKAVGTTTVTTDAIRSAWDAEPMGIVVADSFPGQEAKLAIGKRANAPAVSANYLTQRVNLPSTAEYRLVTATTTAAQLGTWTSVVVPEGSKAKTIPTEVSLAADTTLEVRTKATDTKPASKITQFAFVAKGAVPVIKCTSVKTPFLSTQKTTAAGVVNTSGTVANAVKFIREHDVVANIIAADKDTDLITAEYVPTYTNAKKTAYKSMKIKFTNTTLDAYEIIVANADVYTGTTLPASDVKGAVTVAAATKNAKTGVVTPKATSVAVKDGQMIFVRKKGVAKTGTWATDFIALGTVVFPTIEAAN